MCTTIKFCIFAVNIQHSLPKSTRAPRQYYVCSSPENCSNRGPGDAAAAPGGDLCPASTAAVAGSVPVRQRRDQRLEQSLRQTEAVRQTGGIGEEVRASSRGLGCFLAWVMCFLAWVMCFLAWVMCFLAWVMCFLAWVMCFLAWVMVQWLESETL